MRKNVGDAIRRNTKMDAPHETITRGISPDLYSTIQIPLFYHLYGRLFGVMNPVVNDLAGRMAQQTSR